MSSPPIEAGPTEVGWRRGGESTNTPTPVPLVVLELHLHQGTKGTKARLQLDRDRVIPATPRSEEIAPRS